MIYKYLIQLLLNHLRIFIDIFRTIELILFVCILPFFIILFLIPFLKTKISKNILIPTIQKIILGFIESLVFSGVICGFLKEINGRKRPNFFDLCEYPYNNNTKTYGIYGIPGNINKCKASFFIINSACRSFPSGHSTYSMASLVYISCLLYFIFSQLNENQYKTFKILISSIPIFIGLYIASTRTRNYWHHFDDIVCGIFLGSLSAYIVFNNRIIQSYKQEKRKISNIQVINPTNGQYELISNPNNV